MVTKVEKNKYSFMKTKLNINDKFGGDMVERPPVREKAPLPYRSYGLKRLFEEIRQRPKVNIDDLNSNQINYAEKEIYEYSKPMFPTETLAGNPGSSSTDELNKIHHKAQQENELRDRYSVVVHRQHRYLSSGSQHSLKEKRERGGGLTDELREKMHPNDQEEIKGSHRYSTLEYKTPKFKSTKPYSSQHPFEEKHNRPGSLAVNLLDKMRHKNEQEEWRKHRYSTPMSNKPNTNSSPKSYDSPEKPRSLADLFNKIQNMPENKQKTPRTFIHRRPTAQSSYGLQNLFIEKKDKRTSVSEIDDNETVKKQKPPVYTYSRRANSAKSYGLQDLFKEISDQKYDHNKPSSVEQKRSEKSLSYDIQPLYREEPNIPHQRQKSPKGKTHNSQDLNKTANEKIRSDKRLKQKISPIYGPLQSGKQQIQQPTNISNSLGITKLYPEDQENDSHNVEKPVRDISTKPQDLHLTPKKRSIAVNVSESLRLDNLFDEHTAKRKSNVQKRSKKELSRASYGLQQLFKEQKIVSKSRSASLGLDEMSRIDLVSIPSSAISETERRKILGLNDKKLGNPELTRLYSMVISKTKRDSDEEVRPVKVIEGYSREPTKTNTEIAQKTSEFEVLYNDDGKAPQNYKSERIIPSHEEVKQHKESQQKRQNAEVSTTTSDLQQIFKEKREKRRSISGDLELDEMYRENEHDLRRGNKTEKDRIPTEKKEKSSSISEDYHKDDNVERHRDTATDHRHRRPESRRSSYGLRNLYQEKRTKPSSISGDLELDKMYHEDDNVERHRDTATDHRHRRPESRRLSYGLRKLYQEKRTKPSSISGDLELDKMYHEDDNVERHRDTATDHRHRRPESRRSSYGLRKLYQEKRIKPLSISGDLELDKMYHEDDNIERHRDTATDHRHRRPESRRSSYGLRKLYQEKRIKPSISGDLELDKMYHEDDNVERHRDTATDHRHRRSESRRSSYGLRKLYQEKRTKPSSISGDLDLDKMYHEDDNVERHRDTATDHRHRRSESRRSSYGLRKLYQEKRTKPSSISGDLELDKMYQEDDNVEGHKDTTTHHRHPEVESRRSSYGLRKLYQEKRIKPLSISGDLELDKMYHEDDNIERHRDTATDHRHRRPESRRSSYGLRKLYQEKRIKPSISGDLELDKMYHEDDNVERHRDTATDHRHRRSESRRSSYGLRKLYQEKRTKPSSISGDLDLDKMYHEDDNVERQRDTATHHRHPEVESRRSSYGLRNLYKEKKEKRPSDISGDVQIDKLYREKQHGTTRGETEKHRGAKDESRLHHNEFRQLYEDKNDKAINTSSDKLDKTYHEKKDDARQTLKLDEGRKSTLESRRSSYGLRHMYKEGEMEPGSLRDKIETDRRATDASRRRSYRFQDEYDQQQREERSTKAQFRHPSQELQYTFERKREEIRSISSDPNVNKMDLQENYAAKGTDARIDHKRPRTESRLSSYGLQQIFKEPKDMPRNISDDVELDKMDHESDFTRKQRTATTHHRRPRDEFRRTSYGLRHVFKEKREKPRSMSGDLELDKLYREDDYETYPESHRKHGSYEGAEKIHYEDRTQQDVNEDEEEFIECNCEESLAKQFYVGSSNTSLLNKIHPPRNSEKPNFKYTAKPNRYKPNHSETRHRYINSKEDSFYNVKEKVSSDKRPPKRQYLRAGVDPVRSMRSVSPSKSMDLTKLHFDKLLYSSLDCYEHASKKKTDYEQYKKQNIILEEEECYFPAKLSDNLKEINRTDEQLCYNPSKLIPVRYGINPEQIKYNYCKENRELHNRPLLNHTTICTENKDCYRSCKIALNKHKKPCEQENKVPFKLSSEYMTSHLGGDNFYNANEGLKKKYYNSGQVVSGEEESDCVHSTQIKEKFKNIRSNFESRVNELKNTAQYSEKLDFKQNESKWEYDPIRRFWCKKPF